MPVQLLTARLAVSKFGIYRFLAPFRSRRQMRLRERREDLTWEVFSLGIKPGPRHDEITRAIWDNLRKEQAFVEDFRPDPQDNLAEIYAMGPEEVRYDMVDPITEQLNLDLSLYDGRGFDFASLKTPSDVAIFLMSLAGEKGEVRTASQPTN